MATKMRQDNRGPSVMPREDMEKAKDITHDIVNYLTEYARENPGYAALCCLGVGFFLGWKLKPW